MTEDRGWISPRRSPGSYAYFGAREILVRMEISLCRPFLFASGPAAAAAAAGVVCCRTAGKIHGNMKIITRGILSANSR